MWRRQPCPESHYWYSQRASGRTVFVLPGFAYPTASHCPPPLFPLSPPPPQILVNYLQVTTVARDLDLEYPALVERIFNIGSQVRARALCVGAAFTHVRRSCALVRACACAFTVCVRDCLSMLA